MSESFYSNPQNMFDLMPEHMRPDAILSPQQAASRADIERKELFKTWDKLHAIVLVYEATIRKRWEKRTGIKRREILQGVQPDIPKAHAPEVDVFKGRGNLDDLKSSRNVFLFPFVNLEDLSCNNGVQFLGLLHHRAHNFPSAFAQFDCDTLHFGIISGGIRRIYAQDCTMLCFGENDTYGKVIGWDETLGHGEDDPNGIEMEMQWGDAMPLAEGLTVLEAQRKLLTFLLCVVSKLLVDQNLEEMQLTRPPTALLPPFITLSTSGSGWESTARTNSLRAYLEPVGFSFAKLNALAESSYQLAVQNLIDLRSDPSYLSEQLDLYHSHRLEALSSTARAPQSLVYNRAATFLLSDAYADFAYWHMIKIVLGEVSEVQKALPGPYPRGSRLPPAYENALQELRPVLVDCQHKAETNFPMVMCASPPLRRFFRVTFKDSRFAKNEIRGQSPPQDTLMGILCLLLNKEQTHLWQLTRLYDELDRLSDTSDQRARISPLLAKTLTQRGTYNDIMGMIDSHRPKIRDESMDDIRKRATRWVPILGGLANWQSQELRMDQVAFPTSRFNYPKGVKNMEWARRCEAVDDALVAFWSAADRQLRQMTGGTLFDLVQSILRPHIGSRVSWVDQIRPKASPKLPTSSGSGIPFGGVEQASQGPDHALKPTTKAKEKTHGTPTAQTVHEDETGLVPRKTRALITVSSRAHKVFSMLFKCAGNEQLNVQQGSIAWTEILHAFSELGFALIKTRGSAWRFGHPDGRSVPAHAPHPDSKLDFWKARRFGRHLTRTFEWTGDQFVVGE